MAETSQGLRYPLSGDTPDVPRDIKNLATDVNGKFTAYIQDTLAKRPAPSFSNRIFKATDTGVIYHDTGAAWEPIMPFLALRVATGVTAVSGDYIISGTGTTTLPTATVNSLVAVSAEAAAAVKVVAAGAAKIYGPGVEGVASINLAAGQGVILFATGTNWFIIAGEPKRESVWTTGTATEGTPSATREADITVRSLAVKGTGIYSLNATVGGVTVGSVTMQQLEAIHVGATLGPFRVGAGETWKVTTSGSEVVSYSQRLL